MLRRKVENDAMGRVAQKRLAGRHGVENTAFAFNPEVTLKTDALGH